MMNDSPCVGDLDVEYYQFEEDPFLTQVLQALQQQSQPQPPLTLAYPLVSLRISFLEKCHERYKEVFESIPKWTPRVKRLRVDLQTNDPTSRCHIRTKFLDAVRNNIHLQSVELSWYPMVDHDGDDDSPLTLPLKSTLSVPTLHCHLTAGGQSWLSHNVGSSIVTK